MAENSGIAWTTHTFNPWIGCSKIGPGCDGCYAEAWNSRFSSDGNAPNWGPGAPRRRTTAQNWSKVRKWNREAEKSGERPWVFCASLADVFDNEADANVRADLWSLINETPYLRDHLVTKRVGNVHRMLPSGWMRDFRHVGIVSTVVTQDECDRDLPKLLFVKEQFGVAWVGLSIEPQLERVIPNVADGLDWIITGGESSHRGAMARDYDPAWARDLIEFGRDHSVAVFVKQMGANPVGLTLKNRAGSEIFEWPASLRVREMPFNVD